MKKTWKIVIGVVVAIVILIGLAMWLLLSNVNGVVASAIEKYGSEATGTTVTVGKVDVALTKGSAELHDLVIGNPSGYDSPYALKLKTIRVGIDLHSLSSLPPKKVVINTGVVDGASVYSEFHGDKSNLSRILDNLQQFVGPSKAPKKSTSKMKFVVKNFRFTNGKATVLIDKADVNRTITIPDVSVHNIGVKAGGVNAANLARQLLQPVIERVRQQARQRVKTKAKKLIEKKKSELKDKADKKLKDKLKGLDLSGG